MSESMKIPYNTWGGVPQTSSVKRARSLTITSNQVPYTYSPLKSDLYITSDMTDENPYITEILNMSHYAELNIPNYKTIKEIPEHHSPLYLRTNQAQDWSYAFTNCGNISSIFDPFYDTSNATNMNSLFDSCRQLTMIPNFDTGNVTDMSAMFDSCRKLTMIPNYDTSNVINMANMFQYCSNLTTVPNFNTSKVTNTYRMFCYCTNLTTVPNFDTSNVTDMSAMFDSCRNLTKIPNLNSSNVTNFQTFAARSGITDTPNINISNAFKIDWMFQNCNNLVNVSKYDMNNVVHSIDMFQNCTNLNIIPNFTNTKKLSYTSRMFQNCTNLKFIPLIELSDINQMQCMYENCINIEGNLYIECNNTYNTYNLFTNTPNYTKNIYCHVNTTTYNTVYADMGNNTYNSNWNAYLKTFENDPIGSISQIDSIQIDSIPDGEIYQNTAIFRSPVNTCAVYIPSPDNKTLFTGPNFKLDPYTDYNFKVEFVAPTTSPTDPVDPESLALPTPMNLQIYAVSNTSNICIANTNGIFLPSEMNTINIYINGYYPKTGDPESNINICNIN